MPRSSRNRAQLSEEEKIKRRREQKKLSMRRARAKLDAVAIEERRRKDRERYHQKKRDGLIKTIKDFTPRQQRQIRKMWREKSQLRREKEKVRKHTEEILNQNTPPTSLCTSRSSFSRIAVGKAIRLRNRCMLKAQNKRLMNRLSILERILTKYRMRLRRIKETKKQENIIKINLKQKIGELLTDDENSRLTAGEKETITRRKVKKQIRLLNDTLINLHKKFNNVTGLNISYETFRRYRPFWIIFPKVASRNTCLCSLHTNNDYVVRTLHQAKVVRYSSATDLAKSLCCNDTLNIRCLERKCLLCSKKSPEFHVIKGNDTIVYQRWVSKAFTEIIKGSEKLCKKTVKESVKTCIHNLVNILKTNLLTFMQHLANIIDQNKAKRLIKQNLTPLEGLLHIDFSENYCCKYGSEIQSDYFGGSKPQLSLHTCVYYSTDYKPPQNFVKTTSICSVSENLRHDPVLICAHLTPVIERIKFISPNLKNLHIVSDGPTTQYRNKTMFHMIVNYLTKISSAETIVWHFSEVGAPDGVGGCVKRICDNVVANGKDISDLDSFVNCLRDYCKGIEIIRIDETHTSQIQNIANANKCCPFKGTFQIHQMTWSVTKPNVLHVRRLSCTLCAANDNCLHFEIGEMYIECVSDILEDSSETQISPPSLIIAPSPASTTGTASASTISGPRSPFSPLLCTPSPNSLENTSLQPNTPEKRILFDKNSYSDDSVTPIKKFRTLSSFFSSSDESDENIF